jgi:arginase family enzyme
MKIKFFGSALDPADSPDKVAVKRAYLDTLHSGKLSKPNFLDPYDAIFASDTLRNLDIVKVGKFPVESWLTPKPLLEDLSLVTPENYRTFIDSNGCEEYALLLKKFVEEKVLPDTPAMLGVDHSLSGGVINALSNLHGTENISLVLIDAHFDAIPQKTRIKLADYAKEVGMSHPLCSIPQSSGGDVPETYNCGTFLRYLIEKKVVMPENLTVIGTSDYPGERLMDAGDKRAKEYVDEYLSYEKKGVFFIPRAKIDENFSNVLSKHLEKIETPLVYVSLDADVGAFSALYAVRFLDAIGIDESAIYELAKSINKKLRSGKKLAGFDVMEMDVHLMGAKLSCKEDRTAAIAGNFAKLLLES